MFFFLIFEKIQNGRLALKNRPKMAIFHMFTWTQRKPYQLETWNSEGLCEIKLSQTLFSDFWKNSKWPPGIGKYRSSIASVHHVFTFHVISSSKLTHLLWNSYQRWRINQSRHPHYLQNAQIQNGRLAAILEFVKIRGGTKKPLLIFFFYEC